MVKDGGDLAAEGAAGVVRIGRRNDFQGTDGNQQPILVEGRPRIVEWFCLPYNIDFSQIQHINTNNIWLDVKQIHRPIPLQWYQVEKTVNDETIIQFERIISQYSWYCECSILHVNKSRFIPAKTKDQVAANQPLYQQLVGA